jgi:hypothetical protein
LCVKLRPKLSLTRECEVVCETASQTESDKECEVVCVKLRPKLSLTRECEVVCVKLRPKLSLTRSVKCVNCVPN